MHGYRDEEIVALLWARDEKALEAFSAQYRTLCLRMAENMLGERESAEECLNDVLFELWRRIPPERPEDLKAYIAVLSRNRAVSVFRTNSADKRGGNAKAVSEELLFAISDGVTLAEEYESKLAGEIINKFLDKQKKNDRAVFVMRYFMNENIKDISEKTGYSSGKIKMMLMRMRRRLEEELRKEGILI